MQKVHFIGIGGIGISALARYFVSQGYTVSGSDVAESALLEELRGDGIAVAVGARAGNVPTDASLVIYSSAVPPEHIEMATAREYDIPLQSYPEALGELTERHYTIAVSGSHGKSTTTSLVSLLLVAAKLDPTVIVGTKLREFKNKNFRAGQSEYLVIEADEWNRSFHNYFPKVVVLTNIDKEHLDTYKTYAGVIKGFVDYLRKVQPGGVIVGNFKDKGVRKAVQATSKMRHGKSIQIVWYNKGKFKKHPLQIPGRHNQMNAEAAWQAFKVIANNANVKQDNAKKIAEKVFKSFRGAWRRAEKLEMRKQRLGHHLSSLISHIYSDYGHHPTEVKAALEGLREAHPKQKLVCIFEPHQRDRMSRLFKEFVHAFDAADILILLPIYTVKGREQEMRDEKLENKGKLRKAPSLSAKIREPLDSFALAQAIRGHKADAFYAEDVVSAMKIVGRIKDKSVVVFMGAGDIDANARRYLDIVV